MHDKCIYYAMGSTTITISDEAYRILKAQKKEGESFSDVILRTFPKGHPARILAALQDRRPLDEETAESIRKVSEDLRRNLKLRDVGL
jgi:predicted CopG family antitoxin